ncbi:hypothetical protein [Mycolicibacterium mengxianglii]|uniref:hypothetical protein n=1 Tax=Mycolicibacterium mengxianglii TaxID=2736649 RepID=UPI0018D154CE|nr:hypothetical protein [Mycolicibacterium mengxianglii]
MKNFGFATVAATALAAGAFALAAPALAAPSAGGNAQDTISSLRDQGYKVVVNRLSNAALDQATVVSVGEGTAFTHSVSGANSDGDKLYGPVTTRTVYVNVR